MWGCLLMLPWSPSWSTVGPHRQRRLRQPSWGEWKVVHAAVLSIILESEKMLGPKAICLMPGTFPWCSSHSSPCCLRVDTGGAVKRWLPDPAPAAAGAVTLPVADWGGWWANLVYLCLWPEPRMLHAAPLFSFPQLLLLASDLFLCFMSPGISCIKGQDSLKASLLWFRAWCEVIFPPAQQVFF